MRGISGKAFSVLGLGTVNYLKPPLPYLGGIHSLFALNSRRRESELCSLLRPVEWQMTAAESFDGQISRVTPVEDGLKNIRGKEGTPQNAAKIYLIEIESFRGHCPGWNFAS